MYGSAFNFSFYKDMYINLTGILLLTIIVRHTPKNVPFKKLNEQFSNAIQEEIFKIQNPILRWHGG